jgi:DNA-binding beta-propeller fold protein YncE
MEFQGDPVRLWTFIPLLLVGCSAPSVMSPLSGAPFLAVVNAGNSTVSFYSLSGIHANSSPQLVLGTGPGNYPVALAFDPQGNLWVGGGNCAAPSSFLEEFKAPFVPGERPIVFSPPQGSAYALAFDGQGHLWIGEADCANSVSAFSLIQEYSVSSGGLSSVGSPLKLSGTAYGLAFDSSGNLWVSLADNQATELLEYFLPLSSTSQPQTYSLANTPYGFGPLTFDAQGNPYGFVQESTASLEELVRSKSTFSSVFEVSGSPFGLTFDPQGNLWISDINGIQEFQPPFSSNQAVLTLTQGIDNPKDLAIWP